MPSFRKLWGSLNTLEAGKYYLRVENNFNVSSFDGHKYFVISTTNVFGGQHSILSFAYITIGALCILVAIIITAVVHYAGIDRYSG